MARGATKSPKQRATEAKALAARRVQRTKRMLDKAAAAHGDAEEEYAEAVSLYAYAEAHPALRDDPQLPLGGEA